jgi:hypothetical protein
MMQMSGLKMPVYWAVAFVYNLLLYAVVIAAIAGVSVAFRFRFFVQTRCARHAHPTMHTL